MQRQIAGLVSLAVATIFGSLPTAALAQVAPPVVPSANAASVPAVKLADSQSVPLDIGQGSGSAPVLRGDQDIQPIDLTPVKLPERGGAFNTFDAYKAGLLYRLPARVFFNATCENSLRLETNVFQTDSHGSADMVYRVLPNVTVGYALTKRTRVSSNFFFFRDQYTRKATQLGRNIYSVGFRADHDIPIGEKTNVTASFFARELFFNVHRATPTPLCDLIPQLVIVRRVGTGGAIYGSVLGQIRFTNMLDRFQEGDQFYSVGGVWRKRPWIFTADTTFITNFGNSFLRGAPNNQVMILTLEAGRRIHPKVPLTAFCRVEPIFNMTSNTAGTAGFNFRVFGGLRAEMAKPAIFPVKLKGG